MNTDINQYNKLFIDEEKSGEGKINIIRLISLLAFYLNELMNYYIFSMVDDKFHSTIRIVVGFWLLYAVANWIFVNRLKLYHFSIKYFSASIDVIFLSWILLIGAGPKSPLIAVFYLIIALQGFRYSRFLTIFTSILSAISCLFLQIHALKFRPEMAVPSYVITIYIIAMILMGILSGYIVSQLKILVQKFIENIRKREKVENVFSRYVSHQVASQILENIDALEHLKGVRRYVTVLMSDIRGFTTLAEALPPEEVMRLLNEYFHTMIEIVFRYDGTLDKFIGDAILVVFGAPLQQDDNEFRAVCCALDMQKALNELNNKRITQKKDPIHIGIGINSGEVVAGNVGSEFRTEYTVLGDTVNLTQRLESASDRGQILISEEAYLKVASKVKVNSLPPFKVKGRKDYVKAYELLGRYGIS